MTHVELLTRLAEQGTPRGADMVLDDARASNAAQPYVSVDEMRAHRDRAMVLIAAALVLIVAVGGLVLRSQGTDDDVEPVTEVPAVGASVVPIRYTVRLEGATLEPGEIGSTLTQEDAIAAAGEWLEDGDYRITVVSGRYTGVPGPMDDAPLIVVIQWDVPDAEFSSNRIALLTPSGEFEAGLKLPNNSIQDMDGSALDADTLAATQAETGSERWDRWVESGWIPTGGEVTAAGAPGVVVPPAGEAWLEPGSLGADGAPVYDRPNGELIGYLYINLCYVSKEVADSPGFDPAALRIERHGCDTVGDSECVPRGAEEFEEMMEERRATESDGEDTP